MEKFTTGHVIFPLSTDLVFSSISFNCLIVSEETFNYESATLLYGAVSKTTEKSENGRDTDDEKDDSGADKGILRLTKAERRAKLKKSKKEAKKQGKELEKTEEVQETPQASVLVLSDWSCHAFLFSGISMKCAIFLSPVGKLCFWK